MLELSKQEAKNNTILMWGWLVDNPDKTKTEWMRLFRNEHIGRVMNSCYLCALSYYENSVLSCHDCLMAGQWYSSTGEPHKTCCDWDGDEEGESFYAAWEGEEDLYDKSFFALLVYENFITGMPEE